MGTFQEPITQMRGQYKVNGNGKVGVGNGTGLVIGMIDH